MYLMVITELCAKLSGQPRRHLLQSGWSVFVSSKRLVAGDAFIFLRYVVVSCPPSMIAIPQSSANLLACLLQRRKW